VGEVKKSVNPRVYKSASVRNLPVPVQSLPVHWSIMDSEGSPFESEEEMAYNRAIGELAKVKLDCATQLGKLQQEVTRLASSLSGDTTGDGDSAAFPAFINSTAGSGNETLVSGNRTSFTTVISGVFNSTSGDGGRISGDCPVCPTPVEGDCPPAPDCPTIRECIPCVRNSPDACQPSSPDGPSISSAADETSMAFVVGVLASLLVLAVAVLIGVLLRYLPIVCSGLLFIGLIALVWHLSSKYPEAARSTGRRLLTALRDAANWVLRRHPPEVSAVEIEIKLKEKLLSSSGLEGADMKGAGTSTLMFQPDPILFYFLLLYPIYYPSILLDNVFS
jgi:hypothetical protein